MDHTDIGARAGGVHGLAKAVLLATLVAGLGACSLPGYRVDPGGDGDSAWYEFDGDDSVTYAAQDNAAAQNVDYEPELVRITPRLIARQKREHASEELTAAQKEVTRAQSKVTNYEIGPGDVLQVIVFGHPELTNPGDVSGGGSSDGNSAQGQLVGADGKIFYPYVGELQAAGLTIKELRRKITSGLDDYIREPQVDVRIREYRSQRVYISGDIVKPCTVSVTDVTLTVLQALDQCDTLASKQGGGVGVQNVVLIRDGNSTALDLNEIYESGRPIPLKPGDRLLVDDSANRVFMVGEFSEQTALPYSTGGMSLSDAIADAGGVNLNTADTSSIYVVRGFVGNEPAEDGGVNTQLRPTVFKLDASSVGGLLLANNFRLRPRDVVFAAPASLVNLNRALALITPSLDLLFRSYLIYDRSSSNNN